MGTKRVQVMVFKQFWVLGVILLMGLAFGSCAKHKTPQPAANERALVVPREIESEDALAPLISEPVSEEEIQEEEVQETREDKQESSENTSTENTGASSLAGSEVQSAHTVDVVPALRPYLGCFQTKPDAQGRRFQTKISVSRSSYIVRDTNGNTIPVLVLEFFLGEGRIRRLELPLTTRTAATEQGPLVTFTYQGDLGRIQSNGETYRAISGVQMYFVFGGAEEIAPIETFAINVRILSEGDVWNEVLNSVLERTETCGEF